MPKYSNWTNGIGKSEQDTASFATLINCDIHSNPGKLQASFLMTKNSGSTVTELCENMVVVSNGDSFWFSSESGKVWKRTYAGVWSLCYTLTTGICCGAELYNGYIFYASYKSSTGKSYIGRMAEGLASSQSTWTSSDDGWKQDTHGVVYKSYHPMIKQGNGLYIGNNTIVASVDTGFNFNANALDLPPNQVITAMYPYEEDLIEGTIVQDNFSKSGVFRWDRFSDAPLVSDYLQENGVNMFINSDNSTLASIGINGTIYEYTGAKMQSILKLKNADADMNGTMDILPAGTCNYYGKPCINHKYGIYTLHRNDASFPLAMNIEWRTSGGASITPGAIGVIELNLLASWKSATDVGVDMISSNRANAIIVTPVHQGYASNVIVKYSSLPTGTSIGIETKVNGGAWITQTPIVDSINNVVYFDGGLGDTTDVQARITLNSATTHSPIIEYIEIQ